MVIASPWSRGGNVCSEVFDHTSPLQLLEKLLSHKTGKKIEEPNITQWRRTVCGDLTSAFRPNTGEKTANPAFLERDAVVEAIHRAQFMKLPSGYKTLSAEEVAEAKRNPASPLLPKQEPGIRPSAPLPYQLYSEGALDAGKEKFTVRLEARNEVFGKNAAGSPFNVFALGGNDGVKMRAYAVAAGDGLTDSWSLGDFPGGNYHLQVHGPNGFMREFQGSTTDPAMEVQLEYARRVLGRVGQGSGILLVVVNRDNRSHTVEVKDMGYGAAAQKRELRPGGKHTFQVNTTSSHGWYDLSLRVEGAEKFGKRYAGRVETGLWSYSDPVMGRVRS
jgi:phospholipase C